MTGWWNKNVHSKVPFKGKTMTRSWNKNVHTKVSFKGSRMTGSWNKNVHSKETHHSRDHSRYLSLAKSH